MVFCLALRGMLLGCSALAPCLELGGILLGCGTLRMRMLSGEAIDSLVRGLIISLQPLYHALQDYWRLAATGSLPIGCNVKISVDSYIAKTCIILIISSFSKWYFLSFVLLYS